MKLISNVVAMSFLLPLLSGCDFFDSKLVTACEAILKERLISPSEYRRIKVSELEGLDLDRTQLEGYLLARQRASRSSGHPTPVDDASIKDDLRSYDDGQLKPILYNASIVYEAFNAYKIPVRYIANCAYLGTNGDSSNVWEYRVTVDEKTSTEWLFSKAKRY
ncbi:hypothetical protein [Rhizobium sp. P44RR-XXIV]|uniref:hypothetical protein n=1 Tax=Rhizobium sp. P44RR-XXIV TaxID=1921145 RepID=UPI0009851594|nr:hypothetical protein [Rhizobium sp. P44RR-XXIV]TIX88627.1 hypothetical protein BSK43_018300 [Rhizobium sp. P44RR-XXIV]